MKPYDGVLIDNDVWVRSHWEQRCRLHGKSIKTFASVGQFMESCANKAIDRMKPVFIDSQLDDPDGLGEVLAKRVYDEGFRNIFLATTMPPQNKSEFPHLRGFVSKEPPQWFVSSEAVVEKTRQHHLEKMNVTQRARFDARMKELNQIRNGANQEAWPIADGSGAYWPKEVLEAWESALYHDPSDQELEKIIHGAWLETLA